MFSCDLLLDVLDFLPLRRYLEILDSIFIDVGEQFYPRILKQIINKHSAYSFDAHLSLRFMMFLFDNEEYLSQNIPIRIFIQSASITASRNDDLDLMKYLHSI